MSSTEQRSRARLLVLGGGVAGLSAARHLDRHLAGAGAEVTLVSRDNFFLLPPLLFEACSGVLELRHCSQPIRPCLRRVRFVEATVQQVDVERRVVRVIGSQGAVRELPYDHVVVALGARTNMGLIPGSEHARTFKTVADALLLRNHLIERLEHADIETDPRRRRQLLTIVVIGGGLVGVELLGELTAFVDDELRYYPGIRRDEVRFHLFEAGPRLLHESTPFLGEYAARVLRRRGAELHTSTAVGTIEPGAVRWPGGAIEADTVILAAGIAPSAIAASIAVERDRRGRIVTDPAMRSVSHPNVWALGDCAAVPSPDGNPYPALAQHAVREGRVVAHNIRAVLNGREPKGFVYRALGTMAAFGHTRAAADVRGFALTGFLAWWMRRTYYLFQMPLWSTRVRIALDWTVALFFRPDLTKVDLAPEREQESRNRAAGGSLSRESENGPPLSAPHAQRDGPKEDTMSLNTIARQLVDLCNQGKNFDVMRTMYAPDIVSVEGDGAETRGQGPVIKKSETWQGNNTIHSEKVRGPFFNGPDQFAVHFTFEVTPKGTGQRRTIEEVGVYTVKGDKITREQFFYDGEH